MADAVTTAPALTATVLAVCGAERMEETSAALAALREHSAVRTILISLGADPQPPIRAEHNVTSIAELLPRYLNNAVASLRLSSLPSIAWWRGGDVELLTDLAELVDRLVLDAEDPREAWAWVPRIAGHTMVSDLRWTQLTRWRNLMSQFFDVPHVRSAADSFTELDISGADIHAARLFAGWLRAALPRGESLKVRIAPGQRNMPIESISLGGDTNRLTLALAPASACIHTAVALKEREVASRSVPLGARTPDALISEELRVRARDLAFERAVEAAAALS